MATAPSESSPRASGGGGGGATLFGISESEGGETESEYEPRLIPFLPALKFGGAADASGAASAVTVDARGSITTKGTDAYGVLAQSIGGGGGFILSPSTNIERGAIDEVFGEGVRGGDGGAVSVTARSGARITTSGAGAAGIIAQSIAGGGGLIGGLSNIDVTTPTALTDGARHLDNNGAVKVSIEPQSTIETTGRRAHGIVAQSLVGGGLFAGKDGEGFTAARSGSGPCGGCVARIELDLNSLVLARGEEANAVFAQTSGYNGGVTVNIGGNGVVYGNGTDGSGLFLDSAGTNVINNSGYLGGYYAVRGSAATINNYYLLEGDLVTVRAGGGPQHIVNNFGTLWADRTIQADRVTNTGSLVLNSHAMNSLVATLTGQLASNGNLILRTNADGVAPRIDVTGPASMAGQVLIWGTPDVTRSQTILTSPNLQLGTLTVRQTTYNGDKEQFEPFDSPLFYFDASLGQPTELQITPHLRSGNSFGAALDEERAETADLLAATFEAASPSERSIYQALYQQVGSAQAYADALETIGGGALGALAASRLTLQRAFMDSLTSCDLDQSRRETDCVWARVGGTWLDSNRGVGFEGNTTRYQLFGQKEISDGWLVGASAAYDDGDISSTIARTTADADAYSLALFAKYQTGGWRLGGSVSGALVDYKARRSVALSSTVATSSPRVHNLGLQASTAYVVPLNEFYVEPSLKLTAQYLHLDRFQETGSAFPLEIEGGGDWSFSFAPSVELGADLAMGALSVRPFASAGAVFDRSNGWEHRIRIAGSPSLVQAVSSRTELPEVLSHLAAGVRVTSNAGLAVEAAYNGELADGFNAHTAQVRVLLRF